MISKVMANWAAAVVPAPASPATDLRRAMKGVASSQGSSSASHGRKCSDSRARRLGAIAE